MWYLSLQWSMVVEVNPPTRRDFAVIVASVRNLERVMRIVNVQFVTSLSILRRMVNVHMGLFRGVLRATVETDYIIDRLPFLQ